VLAGWLDYDDGGGGSGKHVLATCSTNYFKYRKSCRKQQRNGPSWKTIHRRVKLFFRFCFIISICSGAGQKKKHFLGSKIFGKTKQLFSSHDDDVTASK
jgi:hypothetical protein